MVSMFVLFAPEHGDQLANPENTGLKLNLHTELEAWDAYFAACMSKAPESHRIDWCSEMADRMILARREKIKVN